MSVDQERIAALEQFAIRITRLTPANWVSEETTAAIAVAEKNPSASLAHLRAALLLARGAEYAKAWAAEHPGIAAPQAPGAAPIDQNEVLRRDSILLDVYEREVGTSKSYATVITGAGYAGLIAIWSLLQDHIGKTPLLVSAMLIGVSLAVFVLWEMAKVRHGATDSAEYEQAVRDKFFTPEFETAIGVVKARAIARTAGLNRYQPASFMISAVTGFGAAAILFAASMVSATGLHITFG
jgi:hypothetical protein